MCGIAGFQGEFPVELLGAMASAMAHRGPDGQGTFVHEASSSARTGLAHRRLSIIDLSAAGNQPMALECPRCRAAGLQDLALTYNGELYNYRELRATLVSGGHTFRSNSDSEVLLHLYGELGVEMLPRLNGIFTFAIHDGRASGQQTGVRRGDLFVARDQLGVKPLYFATPRPGFLFASEMKALLRSPAVARDLDIEALHRHLAYLWTPAPATLLRGIRKLEPGHALVVRDGRIARHWSYYEMPYDGTNDPSSAEDLADQVHAGVQQAVSRQMVADVPVGAFLSGGLDSSAVVAMMRKHQPTAPIECYTIGFDSENGLDGTPADLPYARRVAQLLGVNLNEVRIAPDILGNLERILYHLDEPQADPAPINALLIAERARDDGIKVLLSGAGGDDIFSGYRRHRILAIDRALRALPSSARRLLARKARAAASGHGSYVPGALFRKALTLLEHADLSPDEQLVSRFWWSGDDLRRSLYSRDVAATLQGARTAAPLLASLDRIPAEDAPLNRMLFLEAKHFLADHNLNYTDKMGMAAGVEVRVPLLDLDLVRLATHIPPRMKQRGAEGKWIFKKAMERELPRDVVYRPKTGFGAPLRQWLAGDLLPVVEETLSAQSLRSRGLFDDAAVQRLRRLTRAGRVDGTYTLFALVCVELWCRLFVDQPAYPPSASAPVHALHHVAT